MEKSCGIVLFNSGKILILHYSIDEEGNGGHWDFPKGHVEKNEEEIETALRELEEETNIKDIKLSDDFRSSIKYNILKDSKLIAKEVIFFIGKTKIWDVQLSSEHQHYSWLNYEDALNRLTYDNAKKLLQEAHIFMKKENV